ncbi:septum formation inhibitor Maf [Nitrosophilus alvini]|uniref:septum formation inhibitor Maf n=1 Tax=Nitrosophilus alvini TaxID=2714855 RepID=UPI00190CF1A1|nr:septum formation inhibitor Maf [Nitrosophilus alvini]
MVRLCSASETRAKILKEVGIEFIQCSGDFDEEALLEKYRRPESFVYHATKGKYDNCLQKFGLDLPLIVADTVVSVDGEILRKARNKEEAYRILRRQSGNRVTILTCTMYKSEKKEFVDLSATHYVFDEFEEEDLKEYLESEEWIGKAGACMVEGFCKKYIREVRGYESCARGLTIEKLLPFMDIKK